MTVFRNIYGIVSVAAMLLSVVSCSKVRFAGSVSSIDEEVLTKMSQVSFEVDWTNAGDGEIPEEMTLLMSRIQNVTVHYLRHLDGSGNILDAGESDSLSMFHNGLYTLMAVAACGQDDFNIPYADQFEDSLEYRMRDVTVEIPRLTEQEILDAALMDLNPVCPFVRTVEPFYYVKSDNTTNRLISSLNSDRSVIDLKPEKLTRNIGFVIRIRAEEGVSLDEVSAVISGVPYRVHLMSGTLSDYSTGKIAFDMTEVASEQVVDSLTYNEYVYEGEINGFGLFSSQDTLYRTGPGIMNLIIRASVQTPEPCSRVFHSVLNIKNEIDDARLMLQVPDKDEYRLSGTSDVSIEIRRRLRLPKSKVLDDSGQGSEIWTPTEPIVPDKETNPGLEM